MIGIFDSGLGGLSIFRKIKLFLPDEDIIYYADNAHTPYGDKSTAEVKQLALKALKYLEKKGCQIIVIACNTATTSGIDFYRQHIKARIIGVVPVIKTAAQLTNNSHIAILATQSTIKSPYLDNLIKKHAKKCRVKKIACPGLADAIEKNNVSDALLKKYLKKITDEDIIVLGCTHYSLIRGQIQKLVGPNKKVINSNEAVARHVMRLGLQYDLLSKKKRQAKYTFFCSGNKKIFKKRIKEII